MRDLQRLALALQTASRFSTLACAKVPQLSAMYESHALLCRWRSLRENVEYEFSISEHTARHVYNVLRRIGAHYNDDVSVRAQSWDTSRRLCFSNDDVSDSNGVSDSFVHDIPSRTDIEAFIAEAGPSR